MNLTEKVLEVISLLSKGLLCRQIANELRISIRTVQTHLGRICLKLGVNNKVGAVCYFFKNSK